MTGDPEAVHSYLRHRSQPAAYSRLPDGRSVHREMPISTFRCDQTRAPNRVHRPIDRRCGVSRCVIAVTQPAIREPTRSNGWHPPYRQLHRCHLPSLRCSLDSQTDQPHCLPSEWRPRIRRLTRCVNCLRTGCLHAVQPHHVPDQGPKGLDPVRRHNPGTSQSSHPGGTKRFSAWR